QEVRGPVSPSGMRRMRAPRSGPTARNTASVSARPMLPTSSTSRAERGSGFTPAIVVGPGLAGVLADGLFGSGSGGAGGAAGADERQLDGRVERIDPEGEAEQVDLEPLDAARRQPSEAEERELEPAPAGSRADELLAGVVLADRRGWQIRGELGDRAQHPRREGVRVRPGPHDV